MDCDELLVYAGSSTKSRVTGSLKRGQSVTVSWEVSSSEGSWCEITQAGPPPIRGFVHCEQLNRGAGAVQPNYSVSRGAGPGADVDTAIGEALRLSGLEDCIAQLADPSLYLAAIPRNELTPQQTAMVTEMVMRAMRPERFQEAIAANLKSTYPAGAYPQLLELLRTPLARRMTALEVKESRMDRAAIRTFAARLKQHPPSDQRLAIIRKIDQVTRASELTVDIGTAVMEGIASGSKSLTAQQTQKMIGDFRAQYGDQMRQAAVVKLLYGYRAAPDDQLSAYATLLASPAMTRFNEVAQSGLLEATRQASEELIQSMMERFGAKAPSR